MLYSALPVVFGRYLDCAWKSRRKKPTTEIGIISRVEFAVIVVSLYCFRRRRSTLQGCRSWRCRLANLGSVLGGFGIWDVFMWDWIVLNAFYDRSG